MTSLGFQTLWFRGFSLTIGSTSQAISLVVGFFLLGISLGSLSSAYISNNFAFSQKRPLLYYGLLEILGALVATLGIYLLFYQEHLIIHLLLVLDNPFLAKVIIVALFILPSTFFFGAGLPFLAIEKRIEFRLERLYATNTLGGALGCLLFGILIPYYFTFLKSALFALFINFAIFLFSILRESYFPTNGLTEKRTLRLALSSKALLLAGLSGFFFISLEIASERLLGLILGDRTYIGVITLSLILLVIALGAFSVKKLKKTSHIFNLAAILGFLSLFIIYFSKDSALLVAQGHQYFSPAKGIFIFLGLIPLLFSFCLIFPACLTWIKKEEATIELGSYLAINTISALVASLLTTHLLFESIGLHGLMILVTIGLMIISFFTLIPRNKIIIGLGLPIIILFFSSPFSITEKENLIIQEETPQTHFSIIKRRGKEEIYSGNNRLIAPWKRKNIAHAQQALAFFPALYKDNITKTLMVGLGYGITAAAFLDLGGDEAEIVEILPSLVKYTHRYSELNKLWDKNPRAKISVTDGISHLALSSGNYDIISVSIDNAYTAVGSYVLTKEFYTLVKEKLKQDGVFSQLIWGPHLKEIVATLKTTFPYLKLLPAYSDKDYVVIAAKEPLEPKKISSAYDKYWLPYRDRQTDQERSFQENLKKGEHILNQLLKSNADFIISKHSPKMEIGQHEKLGFFWMRK